MKIILVHNHEIEEADFLTLMIDEFRSAREMYPFQSKQQLLSVMRAKLAAIEKSDTRQVYALALGVAVMALRIATEINHGASIEAELQAAFSDYENLKDTKRAMTTIESGEHMFLGLMGDCPVAKDETK